MKKLFGTDGIRAKAGEFPLDDETIFKIGAAVARYFASETKKSPRFLMGRDTRESGAHIEALFNAGATSENAECRTAEIVPTPAVAYLTKAGGFDAGVVISASHNPFDDNGIKIFLPTGVKISEEAERRIEADIRSLKVRKSAVKPLFPSTENSSKYKWSYFEGIVREFKGLDTRRIKIILDCANGAASEMAPALIEIFGADICPINNRPDGRNINETCGSTCIEGLRAEVLREKANLGIAFDGDADRALFIDRSGNLVDGDSVLWILANYFSQNGELPSGRVVSTVMSNIGLEIALRKKGIDFVRTDVGDKYVLDELLKNGGELGGEQSGHIIFPNRSLAGDGIRTALMVLQAMRASKASLAKLAAGFRRYPQILVNVPVREKIPFTEMPQLGPILREIETELEGRGRLLLRYSGTENIARIMIEGKSDSAIGAHAKRIAAVIESAGAGRRTARLE